MTPDLVLAGPLEFTPEETALLLALFVGWAVVCSAPGWLVLGWAAARRAEHRVLAFLAGSLAGLGLCATTAWEVVPSLTHEPYLAALLVWAPCWVLAGLLTALPRLRRWADSPSPRR